MMYRRNASLTPRIDHLQDAAGRSFATMAISAVRGFLAQFGIIEQAERENRQRNRVEKRSFKHASYSFTGGAREQDRRRAQIERGQLTASNGLV